MEVEIDPIILEKAKNFILFLREVFDSSFTVPDSSKPVVDDQYKKLLAADIKEVWTKTLGPHFMSMQLCEETCRTHKIPGIEKYPKLSALMDDGDSPVSQMAIGKIVFICSVNMFYGLLTAAHMAFDTGIPGAVKPLIAVEEYDAIVRSQRITPAQWQKFGLFSLFFIEIMTPEPTSSI